MRVYEDWFNKTAYPYLKSLPGKKVMIGDNLASHLSYNVIRKCEAANIAFILFPPNATDKLQPLDVAVFRSFKLAWRKVLKIWKTKKGATTFKENFPILYKETSHSISNKSGENLISGFRACGLYPLNPEAVLKKFPGMSSIHSSANESNFHGNLVSLLQKERFATSTPKKSTRRRKIDVAPGTSVCGTDFEEAERIDGSEGEESDYVAEEDLDNVFEEVEEDVPQPLRPMSSSNNALSDFDNSANGTSSYAQLQNISVPASTSISAHLQSRIQLVISDLHVGMFIVVRYTYQQHQSDCVRFYVGKIQKILECEKVQVQYMRRYLNRIHEFVFVSRMNNGTLEDDLDQVPLECIVVILEFPIIQRGRHIFKVEVCQNYFS